MPAKTIKYSRQREAISEFLMSRKDHPTADVIYMNVRQQNPNISLGTVYRNLNLLADIGEIQRLRVGDGMDHFDGNPDPHYHFICDECHSITDLNIPIMESVNIDASYGFDGEITGHSAFFYGKCHSCIHKK